MPQERGFLVLLGASVLALGYVLSPFLYAFAIAGVIAVVTWGPYRRLTRRLGQRPRLAAGLLTTCVVLVITVPLTLVLLAAGVEAVAAANRALDFLSQQDLEVWTAPLNVAYDRLSASEQAAALLPEPEELMGRMVATLEGLLLDFTRSVGAGLPRALGAMWRWSIDLVVFCIAVFSAYVRGPDLLHAVRVMAPLRDDYVDRVFDVFRQFASNVAVGIAVAGTAQGLVAALGFWLAGVPAELVLGLITMVASIVPIFGSAVVWVPVVGGLALQGRWGAALFLAVWSMLVTASADNVIKPMLFRSQLQVSPVLILMSLFGGLLMMGPQGLVFGPSVLLLTMTLYTLYTRDFAGPAADASR